MNLLKAQEEIDALDQRIDGQKEAILKELHRRIRKLPFCVTETDGRQEILNSLHFNADEVCRVDKEDNYLTVLTKTEFRDEYDYGGYFLAENEEDDLKIQEQLADEINQKKQAKDKAWEEQERQEYERLKKKYGNV